jgi:CTP synthase
VLRALKLELTEIHLEKWVWLKNNYIEMKTAPLEKTIVCGIVGKYFDNLDSYKSLFEALDVAAIHNKRFVKLKHIHGENYQPSELDECDCILVPGGFGVRGTEGMVNAIKYARTKNIPFFGICLGMHLAIVEYARNVCGIKDAMSQEFDPKTKEPVIYLLTEFLDRQGMVQQRTNQSDMGGTLRLGIFFEIKSNRQLQLPGQSWQFVGENIRAERGHRASQA